MDPLIDRPRLGIAAFFDDSEHGHWSLAAQLVGMIVRLRSDDRRDELGLSVLDELLVPPLAPIEPTTLRRLEHAEWWTTRYRQWNREWAFWAPPVDLNTLYGSDLGRRDGLEEAATAALELFMACLGHPAEVVRTVAAVGASEFLQDLGPLAETILAESCQSGSETIRTLAADALARRNPYHPAVRALSEGDDGEGERSPMNTSMLVHGTWARYRSTWWRPGSPFHEYIRAEVAPDLYAGTDYFRWTGSYSGGARAAAATDLGHWLAAHQVDELTFTFGHSHGGNVVLDAAAEGTAATKLLVLLHVPALARTPEMWAKIQARIRRIVCLRTRFDWVVALDGGGHRFGSHVRDLTVPGVWFSHDAMLNPEVWRTHNLPKELAYELGMAEASGVS